MIYIKKYYRYALIILVSIIILLIFFLTSLKKDTYIEENTMDDVELNSNEEDSKYDVELKFNIKGAVKNPGVYSFKKGERVSDAIEKSGGLLENADTSVINLSKNLFDEMVIIIYTFDEVNAMRGNNVIIQYVEKECNCPAITNDACLSNDDTNYNDNNTTYSNVSKKVSINTASLSELQTLTGIGETKANAIIKYREEHGPFSKIEDLMNVSGIGDATFAKIKDNITI